MTGAVIGRFASCATEIGEGTFFFVVFFFCVFFFFIFAFSLTDGGSPRAIRPLNTR